MTALTSTGSGASGARTRRAGLDWSLFVAVFALIALGGLLVWSATAERPDITASGSLRFVGRHLMSVTVGIALAAPVVFARYERLRTFVPVLYVLVVVGLLVVLPFGSTINGAQSWLALPGGFFVQPGELAKVSVVVGMAVMLTERLEARTSRTSVPGPADVGWAVVVGGLPICLVLLQPDVGTALVLVAIGFGVLAFAGVRWRWLIGLIGAGLIGVVVLISTGVVADYQMERFSTFAHPGSDPTGAGYNVTQARLAVVAGGVFGQGLFQGARTGGGFVPEQHTDFVFTVAAEELGFVGASALLLLMAFVLWRAARIAEAAPDLFGRLTACGVTCWFAVQMFENVGMALGLAPVTGVPLPFVSYGGSSLAACLFAVALLQNIHRQEQTDPSRT